MQGIYNLSPTRSRYDVIWDVSVLTKYLVTLFPLEKLTLAALTCKVVVLLAIISAARCDTLSKLTLENMVSYPKKVIFKIPDLIKQSRPGYKNPVFYVQDYPHDLRKCPVYTLKRYLEVSKKLRKNPQQGPLFISTQKPHLPVCSNTISNWIKKVLAAAGVDTTIFTSHSVRSASTSKQQVKGVPVEFILQNAGWSRESTFARHYKKKIVQEHNLSTVLL